VIPVFFLLGMSMPSLAWPNLEKTTADGEPSGRALKEQPQQGLLEVIAQAQELVIQRQGATKPKQSGTILRRVLGTDDQPLWTQQGDDIDGDAAGDFIGDSVALSGDGNTVAIPFNGHVRVFRWKGNTWTQLGQDLFGDGDVDVFGRVVSLSDDGNTVASVIITGTKRVKAFRLNGNKSWTQLGQDLLGDGVYDEFGLMALSDNGNTIAIGAGDDGKGDGSGRVKVFRLNGNNSWSQLGQTLLGDVAGDFFGASVSLSGDGNTIAIGADGNDGKGDRSGRVKVFRLNGNNSWTQQGDDIDGEAAGDTSGKSVSLSDDGNTVAIGAYINGGNGDQSGHVRVFRLNATGWTQQGGDIDGEAAFDYSGWSVSLSDDGNTVAIGAYGNDGNGDLSGHVRVFRLNENNIWTQQGNDIDGEATNDIAGWSVSLSDDGNTVAVGASEYVRVYALDCPTTGYVLSGAVCARKYEPTVVPSAQPSSLPTRVQSKPSSVPTLTPSVVSNFEPNQGKGKGGYNYTIHKKVSGID